MKKVLLVDDNQLVGKLASAYLCKHGFDVEVCQGPFGVLNRVRAFGPEVILLDINMPGLSGVKLAELLKDARAIHGFKVILFSSEDENMQAGLVKDGLAQNYFIKGGSLEGLCEVINETACASA